MLQTGYRSTLTQFSVTWQNLYPPPDSLEGSPSTISPSTPTLSPIEDDICCDLIQDDVLGDDSSSNELCYASHFPLPEELIDFVNSYAYSGNKQVSVEEMPCDAQKLSDALFSSEILGSSGSSPPLPQQSCKKSYQSSFSSHRMHHVVDGDRQSKKRKLNRDAAYRYRQKVKLKNEKLQGELNAAIQAFKEAREMYECSREYDALMTL
ncbi:hypothetical protein TSMEX_007141 [Taenia solium]|eukprot:TsM_000960300 transcript=TsM_000960300 gene=TsM_000960300